MWVTGLCSSPPESAVLGMGSENPYVKEVSMSDLMVNTCLGFSSDVGLFSSYQQAFKEKINSNHNNFIFTHFKMKTLRGVRGFI